MPTSMNIYARGDGSSANNAAFNVDNKSQQPTVQRTFEASPGGDIVLARNGGAPDPDTTVLINGRTERSFFVNDGTGTRSLMNQFGNGAIALTNANFSPDPVHVSFCAGTVILTPSGYRNIEDQAMGDSVVTARGEVKPILWTGRTDAFN